MAFRDQLQQSWQQPNVLTALLWPLSVIYRCLFLLRKGLYKSGLLKSYRSSVPVIVVGNITVGGTGKTPLVIYLVELLRELGFTPGVISRGYGGESPEYPLMVEPSTLAAVCGDEPALIVRKTSAPMVVGPNRSAAIELLLASAAVDVVISDDGLQHYAMQRDIELCLVDATNPQKNLNLLPAGPYREPQSRLKTVDLVVTHVSNTEQKRRQSVIAGAHQMFLDAATPVSISQPKGAVLDLSRGVHAVAGIGNPQRFFDTCRALGWQIEEHAFPDHHIYCDADFELGDDRPIVMTEKDAVKCAGSSDQRLWYLPVSAKMSETFNPALQTLVNSI